MGLGLRVQDLGLRVWVEGLGTASQYEFGFRNGIDSRGRQYAVTYRVIGFWAVKGFKSLEFRVCRVCGLWT